MTQTPQAPGSSRKFILWTIAILVLSLILSLGRISNEKVGVYVQSELKRALEPLGVRIIPARSEYAVFPRPVYVMHDAVIESARTGNTLYKLQRLSFRPSIFATILGRQSGTLKGESGSGSADVDFDLSVADLRIDYELDALPFPSPIKGALSGSGRITGSPKDLSKLSGEIALDLTGPVITEPAPESIQSFFSRMMLKIHALKISESKIRLTLTNGTVKIGTFQIGKKGDASEDLQAALSGKSELRMPLTNSTYTLEARLKFSDMIEKDNLLLGALLTPFRQNDGTAAMRLNGTFNQPSPPEPLNP